MELKKHLPQLKTTLFSTLLILSGQADALNSIPGQLMIQAGGFYGLQGEAQDIAIVNLVGDHFSVKDDHKFNALVGLGYYFDGLDDKTFNLSYGLNAYYFFKNKVKGDITQEQLYTNLSYKYDVSHLPVYAAVKASVKSANENHAVTFDFGVGPNFMMVNNFSEQSLDGITVPDHAYTSNTRARASAMVGIGFRLNHVIGYAPLECGYKFFYLGQSELKTDNDQIITPLKTGHVTANALICSIII